MCSCPYSFFCIRRRQLTDKFLPARTSGPSHSTSTWITQESDIDLHHSSHQLVSSDTADDIHSCDLHCYSNADHLRKFGVKIDGRLITPLSPPSPRCLGYTLLPQRPSTLSLDWDTPPVESASIQSPLASPLSPAVVSALEGVTYIAEHLKAEDADFSVCADITILIFPSKEVKSAVQQVDINTILSVFFCYRWRKTGSM